MTKYRNELSEDTDMALLEFHSKINDLNSVDNKSIISLLNNNLLDENNINHIIESRKKQDERFSSAYYDNVNNLEQISVSNSDNAYIIEQADRIVRRDRLDNRPISPFVNEDKELIEKLELRKEIMANLDPLLKRQLFGRADDRIDFGQSKEEILDSLAIKTIRIARANPNYDKKPIENFLKKLDEKRQVGGSYKFSKGSDVYNNIMGHNSDYIALKIREAKQKGGQSVDSFNLGEIIKNSPPNLAEKILRIAEKVNEQEGHPPSVMGEALIKFKNFCKGISSKSFDDPKMQVVFEQFAKVSENHKKVPINKTKQMQNSIRSKLEKAQKFISTSTPNKANNNSKGMGR